MRNGLVVITLVLGSVGCDGPTEVGDAGRDAGFDAAVADAGASDAGASADAGSNDAGASDDAGSDAGASDAGATDASTTDGATATCGFTGDLERGCGNDANCVIGVHQTDCCGNTVAIGMNHSERDRFDAAEAACRATYPACGCPSGPTTTDSGETASDPADIQVGCIGTGPSRTCMTYVSTRPSDTP